ncbi:PREDICTED: uncharacterized protein LOC104815272 isoform X2 [Tarenaya hassleriana]|uniref:uncharacterized protein LOC104815272 isoform X2 n=1 Tax=Tarenaya hassleriana TaxID=28532 RepID=UPI0008FCE46F|nr:PREDICTED: uncharacterized protein LOC104815272 isoform X2 [Tarenaya hassleriana]
MPRPGPRPYECVKRAWHSDRHQPIRGSLIRQIFRLVREAHSATTRKNKEWQEKLPVVVLKAEEIMYSKANSEEEYTNAETLWNRVNDAVDTIIRRDESTETGQLLPPCVEAALNLGCVAVRASRSQRHSNLRTYLTPRIQEPVSAPGRTADTTSNEPYRDCQSHKSNKPSHSAKAGITVDIPDNSATENNKFIAPCGGRPFLHGSILQMGHNQLARLDTGAPVTLGSVYPLYYGANSRADKQVNLSGVIEQTSAGPVIIGMPIGVPDSYPGEKAGFQDLFSRSTTALTSRETEQAKLKETLDKRTKVICDLSLRLGPSPEPCARMEKASLLEDVGCSNERDCGSSQHYPRRKEELCFLSGMKKNGVFGSNRGQWFSNHEGQNSDLSIKKRKAMF